MAGIVSAFPLPISRGHYMNPTQRLSSKCASDHPILRVDLHYAHGWKLGRYFEARVPPEITTKGMVPPEIPTKGMVIGSRDVSTCSSCILSLGG